jgi:Flp pilus assembly protein TadD
VRLADMAEMAGAIDEAVTERHRAITAAPEVARLYTDLGVTLLQAGRTAEARDALTESVIRAPYDPAAQLFLFQAAVALGDRGTAERAMHALELFAPRRNRDQVAEARQRLAGLP